MCYSAKVSQNIKDLARQFAATMDYSEVERLLMERLTAAARRRGLARLVGTVLRENPSMLRFTAALGFTVRDDPGDADQVIVERVL